MTSLLHVFPQHGMLSNLKFGHFFTLVIREETACKVTQEPVPKRQTAAYSGTLFSKCWGLYI
jgi:hypothetical protein